MPPALQSTKLRNLPPRGLLSLSTVGATPSWDAIKRIEGIDGPPATVTSVEALAKALGPHAAVADGCAKADWLFDFE